MKKVPADDGFERWVRPKWVAFVVYLLGTGKEIWAMSDQTDFCAFS